MMFSAYLDLSICKINIQISEQGLTERNLLIFTTFSKGPVLPFP